MIRTYRSSLLAASALAAASLFGASAFAQTAETAPPVATPPTPDAAPAEEAADEAPATVVVTGSRIARSTFSSTSPITVITNEEALLGGEFDVTEIIQTNAAAAGSGQQNNSFVGFITEGGPGVNTIGLRGLGPGRTLVLLNGKRLPPAGTRGQVNAVDLNVIPSLAVTRTEVLRDGASAVYGSDAIGGVVNLITRKNVDGFEVDFAATQPLEGGGETYRFGALWGDTGDNYNILVSLEHFGVQELNLRDRQFSRCIEDYVFDPVTGNRADFIDPKTGTYYCRGSRVTGATQIQNGTIWVVDPATSLLIDRRPDATSIPGSATVCLNAFGFQVACNAALTVPGFRRTFYPRQGTTGVPPELIYAPQQEADNESDIYSPVQRTTLFITGAVDLPAGIEGFGEILANRRTSSQNGSANNAVTLPAAYPGNPFGPQAGNPFGAAGQTARVFFAVPYEFEQEVNTWQALAGLRGRTGNGLGGFMKNGRWEATVQTSSAEGSYATDDILRDRRDASANQTIVGGVRTCPAPTISGGACLPIDWFSTRVLNGGLNEAERAYLFTREEGNTVYEQTIVEATVSGDVFNVPAGAIAASLGAQYRTYSIVDTPGREALRGNTAIFSSSGVTKGDDSVYEIFGELEIPLLKGLPLVEELTLNAQGRYTNYESYEDNTTYKVSLNYQVTDQVRLRGSMGTSYRAPALYELYLADQQYFPQASADPCINWGESSNQIIRARCAAAGVPADYFGRTTSITAVERGGLGVLKEETADTHTFGVVWRPTNIDLQVALDYSYVNVQDQVSNYGATNLLYFCYVEPDPAFQFLCSNITRAANSDITLIADRYRNVSQVSQGEISLNVDYRLDLAFGTFSISSESSWQTELEGRFVPGADKFFSLGDNGVPVFNNSTQFQFRKDDWTYTWTTRMVGRTSDATDFDDNVGPNPFPDNVITFNGYNSVYYKVRAEPTIYHGVTVRYASDDWTLIGGLSNMFNEQPPTISTAPNGAPAQSRRLGTALASSQYDLLGRSAFLSVTRRF